MLVFVIPLKSRYASKDWGLVNRQLQATVASLRNQVDSAWKAYIVCHDMPEDLPGDDRIIIHQVDFEEPDLTYEAKNADKARKVVLGHMVARLDNPDYVMHLDADDLVHWGVVEFVNQAVASGDRPNGWTIDEGYEWFMGSPRILVREAFNTVCASCNIVRADLIEHPDSQFGYDPSSPFYAEDLSRFYIGHRAKKEHYGLEPLGWRAAVYVQTNSREQASTQVSIWSALRKNPKILLRPLKLKLRQLIEAFPIQDDLAVEFAIQL